ncbi:MAG: alpha/beta fold hydrolase [bacterium]|nr:alpha/beta fold hydrolase [bacterium]
MVEKVSFTGHGGLTLSGRLELPQDKEPLAYGIFAHCFTCTKENLATSRTSKALAAKGLGVLRFDFAGLGQSEGDFSKTNFSTNVQDLKAAADFMEKSGRKAQFLIGHSLGGAAALFAAPEIDSIGAVVTLNAPCNPQHVQHHFEDQLQELLEEGAVKVSLAGREFTFERHFVADLFQQKTDEKLKDFRGALLVCHAPQDTVVGIEQAAHIFSSAKHPKSFVSLDTADHFLRKKEDTNYAADIIFSWIRRYL